jgi:fructose-bisphosphate aldolase class II
MDAARQSGRGLAAFNVITLEHAEGILDGAAKAGAPVILQISENAVKYHDGRLEPLAAACARLAEAIDVDAALHLDHVTDRALIERAPDAGFGSAMFDASTLPYDENVAATASVAAWGHAHGLWVEAELGEVGGKDGVHSATARTDPAEAAAYVAATGVDGLAVAIGTSHAMLDKTAALDLDLLTRIAEQVPVPLVLHGSSGVPDELLGRAVSAGLTKINIGTALNIAFTQGVRASLAADPDRVDPRRYLAAARTEVADTVAHLATVVSGTP